MKRGTINPEGGRNFLEETLVPINTGPFDCHEHWGSAAETPVRAGIMTTVLKKALGDYRNPQIQPLRA